jgi:hypothetical protein
MQSHASLLSAATLSTAVFLSTPALAGDLPKDGTFNGIYASHGTYKAAPIGKEIVIGSFDENGLNVGTGFLDHVTWHSWGTFVVTKGMGEYHGDGVGTDPDGDQIVISFMSDGKYPQDAKSIKGLTTITAGTGKYAGISGTARYVGHGNEFRAPEGGYLQYDPDVQANYKLP